jgi:ribosomal protein S18 acetylase RimI-like enzyme
MSFELACFSGQEKAKTIGIHDFLEIQNFGLVGEYSNSQRYSLWTDQDFQSEIISPVSQLCLVIDQNKKTFSGFIFFESLETVSSSVLNEREVWIRHWAVREKGKGFGHNFLGLFLSHLNALYGRSFRLGLEVSSLNKSAIEIYRRMGFCKISERKSYYKEGGDAWVMVLENS